MKTMVINSIVSVGLSLATAMKHLFYNKIVNNTPPEQKVEYEILLINKSNDIIAPTPLMPDWIKKMPLCLPTTDILHKPYLLKDTRKI